MAMLPLFAIIIVMVPLRIGFDYDEPPTSPLFWVDVLIDLYFLVDIVVNFRTAYIDDHGQLETNLRMIARQYARSWFLIDFVSCLPIPYVFLLINALNDSDGTSGGQVKLAKILRLARLAKNLARLGRLTKIKELMSTYEDYLEPIMNALVMFKCFIILLTLGHLMACTWYAFGNEDMEREDNEIVYGWVRREGWGDKVGQWTRYLTAFTYVLTDWCIERSYTTSEQVVGFILHLTYEVFFGYLVGTMTSIVLAGNVSDLAKAEKLQELQDLARFAKLPPQKRKHFRNYYDIMYKHKTIFADMPSDTADNRQLEIIEELPESIRKHYIDAQCNQFKKEYTFFGDLPSEIIMQLAISVRRIRTPKGEAITKVHIFLNKIVSY